VELVFACGSGEDVGGGTTGDEREDADSEPDSSIAARSSLFKDSGV